MTLTRIPIAITNEDQVEYFVSDVCSHKYIIEDSATQKILAHGLTSRQTVEFTWLSNGRDYAIKPRLCTLHDDQGKNTGLTTQLVDIFGTEWDVYFKDGHELPWRKSHITAYGDTERAALLDLIDQGFQRKAWSDAYHVQQIGVTDMRKFWAEIERTKAPACMRG